jgi:hypothetical protein
MDSKFWEGLNECKKPKKFHKDEKMKPQGSKDGAFIKIRLSLTHRNLSSFVSDRPR